MTLRTYFKNFNGCIKIHHLITVSLYNSFLGRNDQMLSAGIKKKGFEKE